MTFKKLIRDLKCEDCDGKGGHRVRPCADCKGQGMKVKMVQVNFTYILVLKLLSMYMKFRARHIEWQ